MAPSATTAAYNTNLRAPIETRVGDRPTSRPHAVEWLKVLNGEPVEINPAVGHGFRIMTVDEWSSRWKRNDDYPECLHCGSTSATRECHFVQTWCRAKKCWEAESLCVSCLRFSWRSYRDPDFKTPEQYEAERWAELLGRKLAVKEEGGEEGGRGGAGARGGGAVGAVSSSAAKIKASS